MKIVLCRRNQAWVRTEKLRGYKNKDKIITELVCQAMEVTQQCLTLCDPMTIARQAPLSMEFSRQEYWSGSFPFPGDLPNPGTELRSPALQADALTSEPPFSNALK